MNPAISSGLSGRDFVDVFVTWSAAFAVFAYVRSIHRNRVRSTLEGRALFFLYCVGTLFFVRGFSWLAPDRLWIAEIAFFPITAFPLAATLFAEALLRRHVSLALKLYVIGGTITFLALDLFAGLSFTATYLVALLGFQVTTIGALLVRALHRDRGDLSAAENRLVDVITASTMLIIPLFVTDYRTTLTWIAVPRLGGIGGLLFVFAVVRSPGDARPVRAIAAEAGGIVLRAAVVAATIAVASAAPTFAFFLDALAISLAVVLVTIVIERLRAVRLENREASFLRWLLRAETSTPDSLVASLGELPLTEEYLLVRDPDLRAYDARAITRLADERGGVLSLASLRQDIGGVRGGSEAAEAVVDLLEKYDMTHVVLVRSAPPTLLLLNLPFVASQLYETQLGLIQKHFRMLERMSPPVTAAEAHDKERHRA